MIFEGSTDSFIRILEAFGFYTKKIFLPLPLNVAIREIDPLYAIVGIITLCILVVAFRRIGIPGIFLALAVLFTLPSLVVAATPIAWTPFGERYLYIPSALAVIGSLELSYRFLEQWKAAKIFVPIVSIIIVIASIATINRGKLWGDNLALIEDIIAKSPDFGVARNEYGVLLIKDGRYDEAERQFRIAADQINQDSVNRIIHLNLIGVKIHGKTPNEARTIILNAIGNKSDGDADLLKLLYKCDESILGGTGPLETKRKIVTELIEINDNLYLKTHEPHCFYRSGQLALSIGNKHDAAAYFRNAYENARPDAYYREPARKLAAELGTK
jgi:tetratricopeptide (TPR) repeat protein